MIGGERLACIAATSRRRRGAIAVEARSVRPIRRSRASASRSPRERAHQWPRASRSIVQLGAAGSSRHSAPRREPRASRQIARTPLARVARRREAPARARTTASPPATRRCRARAENARALALLRRAVRSTAPESDDRRSSSRVSSRNAGMASQPRDGATPFALRPARSRESSARRRAKIASPVHSAGLPRTPWRTRVLGELNLEKALARARRRARRHRRATYAGRLPSVGGCASRNARVDVVHLGVERIEAGGDQSGSRSSYVVHAGERRVHRASPVVVLEELVERRVQPAATIDPSTRCRRHPTSGIETQRRSRNDSSTALISSCTCAPSSKLPSFSGPSLRISSMNERMRFA